MSGAQTWWGVLNPLEQLSQLFSSRGLAESALAGRSDRDQCRVVSAKVEVDMTPPKPGPALKRRGKR